MQEAPAHDPIEGEVRFDAEGLLPCIVQDVSSGEVLMFAYTNAEALALTRQTGELHLWSRSRKSLWRKGQTSGNVMEVKALRLDCDGDCLLALVHARGPACHTGERTCFHRGQVEAQAAFEIFPALQRTILERAHSRPSASYTSRLLSDPPLIGEKVMEEAEEVSRAARQESDQRVDEEAADLLYHLLVLLQSRGRQLAQAQRILIARRGARAA